MLFQNVVVLFCDRLIELSKIEKNDRVSVSISRQYSCTRYQNFLESTEISLAIAQKAISKYEGQQNSLLMSFHFSCYGMGLKISKQLSHCDLIYHFLLFPT